MLVDSCKSCSLGTLLVELAYQLLLILACHGLVGGQSGRGLGGSCLVLGVAEELDVGDEATLHGLIHILCFLRSMVGLLGCCEGSLEGVLLCNLRGCLCPAPPLGAINLALVLCIFVLGCLGHDDEEGATKVGQLCTTKIGLTDKGKKPR